MQKWKERQKQIGSRKDDLENSIIKMNNEIEKTKNILFQESFEKFKTEIVNSENKVQDELIRFSGKIKNLTKNRYLKFDQTIEKSTKNRKFKQKFKIRPKI